MTKLRLRIKHRNTSSSEGFDDGLRVLFWNAGGVNKAKFSEHKTLIHKLNADYS